MRFDFQAEDTPLTLREGLAELRSSIPDFIDGGQDYVDHDVLHVIYGLDTTVMSEGLLDVITLAGTDCSFGNYLQLVRRPESKELLRAIGFWASAWVVLTMWPRAIRALLKARAQPKRWPYTAYACWLDVPLPALRAEFGITVPGCDQPGTTPLLSSEG